MQWSTQSIYFVQLMIFTNSGFNEAPPTKNPLISGWEYKSLQFAAVAEPP